MSDQSIDSPEFPTVAVGRERLKSDRRQLGGLMLLFATCATIQPLAGIASLTGTDDTGAATPLEKAALASGLIQVFFGSLGMIVGYLSLIHDYGNNKMSGTLIFLTLFGLMPFITGMVDVGKAASSPYVIETQRSIVDGVLILEEYVSNPFIPVEYLPTIRDVRFFGAMGILGILSYGTAFLGSLAFTEFAIYAFDSGKPTARDARYYRGRLLFYTFVLIIAGVSQLILGGYAIMEFGNGALRPPVRVAMYRVHFPEISVAIGILQMLVGYYGVARYLGMVAVGPNDHQYQILLVIQWISMLLMQYLVQIGYGPGDENAAAVPTLTLLSVGLNVLPAFLDYKMRTVPQIVTNKYYGLMATEKNKAYQELAPPGFEQLDSESSFELDLNGKQDIETGNTARFTTTSSEAEEEKEATEREIDNVGFLLPPVKRDCEEEKSCEQFHLPQDNSISQHESVANGSSQAAMDALMDEDRADVTGRPEPSARLDDRKIDLNEETNQLYEQLSQSQAAMDALMEESLPDTPGGQSEPSACLDSLQIDRNILIDEMYEQQSEQTEPHSNRPKDVIEENSWSDQECETPLTNEPSSLRPDQKSVTSDMSDDPSQDLSQGMMSQDTSNQDTKSQDTRSQDSKDSQDIQDVQSPPRHSDPPVGGLGPDKSDSERGAEPSEESHSSQSGDIYSMPDPPEDGPRQVDMSFDDGAYDGYSSESDIGIPDDTSASDDSTAVLEEKLEAIERELFTDSMESFEKSLVDLL
jgi:hypothetical protein